MLFIADSAKMIDIDHETKYAYSDNLSIPGEEAVLQEPNMDQIDAKLSSPNLTGIFAIDFLSDHIISLFSLSRCR